MRERLIGSLGIHATRIVCSFLAISVTAVACILVLDLERIRLNNLQIVIANLVELLGLLNDPVRKDLSSTAIHARSLTRDLAFVLVRQK